jgi:hypothetical protein
MSAPVSRRCPGHRRARAARTLAKARSEARGGRWLRANTSKNRQHSLFRQGLMLCSLLPGFKEDEAGLRSATTR